MNEEKKETKTTSKKTGEPKKTTVKKTTATKKKTTSTESKSPVKKNGSTTKKKSTTSSKTSGTKKTTTAKKTSSTNAKKKESTTKSTSKQEETVVKQEKILKARPLETTIVEEEKIELEEPKKKVLEPVLDKKEPLPKEISFTNYIIALLIVAWVFIIVYFGYKIYQKYQENLYDEGYFYHEKIDIKKVKIGDIVETLSNDSKETVFVLFNYRDIKETYDLEKDLYSIMKDYHLEDNFYYVDLTDSMGQPSCNELCILNSALNTDRFLHVPSVAYFKNGQLYDIAQREDQKVLEGADFVKLLDIYEFKK